MLDTLKNAWKIVDLRKRILFTVLMLIVYRGGAYIPVPFVNIATFKQMFEAGGATLFGFFDLLSGGAFRNFTIFAMGIIPYINSSIIMNLLTIAIPKLEQMSKEGEEGRKKIAKFTRYGTVVLGAIQASGIALLINSKNAIVGYNTFRFFIIVITLTAGTSFLMWLGEQITDKGIGNGISLLIFISIVSRYPAMGAQIAGLVTTNTANMLEVIIFVTAMVVLIGAIVTMDLGERRIPVQYAKKVVGRKMYGGQSTHIPINVNCHRR
jgi:preprotein translocase subunit SecY